MEINECSSAHILMWRKSMLIKGGSSLEIDWLLEIGGGLSWTSLQKLYLYPNSLVQLDLSLEKLETIWSRHILDQIPLQYLLGKCPWRDFELDVNSNVLIPRQESELMIEFALEIFNEKSQGLWVDLGTGSGALAIALARSLKAWEGHAVDCSKAALSLAQKNISKLAPDSKVTFHLGDWWDPLQSLFKSIDLVISNPPYIPTSTLKKLDPIVYQNEPNLALCGGDDGLDSCRKVISGAIKALSPKGLIIMEHHYDQSERVLQLMEGSGLRNVRFEEDLNGIRRFAIGFGS